MFIVEFRNPFNLRIEFPYDQLHFLSFFPLCIFFSLFPLFPFYGEEDFHPRLPLKTNVFLRKGTAYLQVDLPVGSIQPNLWLCNWFTRYLFRVRVHMQVAQNAGVSRKYPAYVHPAKSRLKSCSPAADRHRGEIVIGIGIWSQATHLLLCTYTYSTDPLDSHLFFPDAW